ncbi:hypothetical protein [Streptomyces sioyaensis]|uniref:hypothetical protein n=1 Tax=Streptomyces sioyaensis TaxID=67364 RepID=UPI0037B97557
MVRTPRSIADRPEDRSISSCPRAHMFVATGRTAFGEGNPDALFYRTLNEPPELDDCPPTLRAAVKRCLARDPKKRPAVSELMEYARKQTAGETLTLAGSWLPEAVATSLTGYDTKPYVPPKTKKAHKGDTATATTEKSTKTGGTTEAKPPTGGGESSSGGAVAVIGLLALVAFLVIGPDKVVGAIDAQLKGSPSRSPTYSLPSDSPSPDSDATGTPACLVFPDRPAGSPHADTGYPNAPPSGGMTPSC